MLDAILRTLTRVYLTRRDLLEWMTAAHAKARHDLDLPGYYRSMAGGVAIAVASGVLVLVLRAVEQPDRGAVRRPLAALAAGGPMGQPDAPRVGRPRALGRRCPDAASRRPSHLALLRDVRGPGGPRPAARQLPGGAGARRRASDVADQHRHVPALDRHGPGLRVDRHTRDGGATRGDPGDGRPASNAARPPVQLVRHA